MGTDATGIHSIDKLAADEKPGPAATPSRHGHWRFAGMELDETSGRLWVDGASHVLDHGSYGVLHALLRQAGSVVSKDELLRVGWPGRVVAENSLTKAIGRLRQALADPDGVLLCTAHGYGYRLATRAEWQETVAFALVAEPASPAATPPRPGRYTTPRTWLLLAAVLAVGLATAYALRPGRPPTEVATPALASTTPVSDGPSIAVLPFADLSEKHDQAYFSDGLADELLDRLAKLPQLRVVSRTSSFAFRDSDESIASIGRKLNVSTILEGSVRRDGNRLRITVQLIKVNDGFHLWSETYDKQLTDLFTVQDDISRAVVAALKLELLPGQDLAVTRHRTRSLDAFNLYLAGQRYRRLSGAANDRRAIAAYEKAIALDPEFSSAHAALADALGGDAEYADSAAEVAAGKERSILLMDKAIALEPDNADFYLARADLLYSTRHAWTAAQRDLDTAGRLLRRRPPELLMRQCRLLAVLGRIEEAIAIEQEVVRSEPESGWAWALLGYHLTVAGRYEQARVTLVQADRIQPDNDRINFYIGLSYLLDGKLDQARESFEHSGAWSRLTGLAITEYEAGNKEAAQLALESLAARYGNTAAYQVAEVYAWRGEPNFAFEWLNRALAQQDAGVMYLKFDPLMRRLRGDRRYDDWLLKLGLDDRSLTASR